MRHNATDRGNGRNRGGFSVVELMVAMVFVGVGLLSLAQVFIMSNKNASVGKKDSVALNLSNEILERMRTEKFDDMVATYDNIDTKVSSTVPAPARAWASHVTQQLGIGARGRVDVLDETDDATLTDGLVRVDVITTWVERGDTVNLKTSVMISKMGV